MSRETLDGELGYRVAQLRNDVDDLGVAIDDLPQRLGGLDGAVAELRTAVRQVQVRSAEVEAAADELGALLKRLDARVEWLERNIRMRAGAAEAELDDVDPRDRQLAQVAEAGHVARSEVLAPAARSSLEAAVAAHADACRARERHCHMALAACEVLAETSPDDDRHASAVTDFRLAVSGRAQATARVEELARAAREATAALDADESGQIAVADVLAAGERAWATLRTRLRARVADAGGEGALLPAWFTSVLGPIPPAQDTRAWMDVATNLLAYRVTYAVTDPTIALGRAPAEDETARRRAWYLQLRRQLGELRR